MPSTTSKIVPRIPRANNPSSSRGRFPRNVPALIDRTPRICPACLAEYVPVRRAQKCCGFNDCKKALKHHRSESDWRASPQDAAQRRRNHERLEGAEQAKQMMAETFGAIALVSKRPPRRCGCGCRRLVVGPDVIGHRGDDGRPMFISIAHREWALLKFGSLSSQYQSVARMWRKRGYKIPKVADVDEYAEVREERHF